MKAFIVISCLALLSAASAGRIELTEEQKVLAKEHGNFCAKEVALSDEEYNRIKAKDFSNPSDKVKCFTNCYFEKIGSIKDGVVQEDVVLQKLGSIIGEEKTREYAAKCNGLKGENICDTAFMIYKCYEQGIDELNA